MQIVVDVLMKLLNRAVISLLNELGTGIPTGIKSPLEDEYRKKIPHSSLRGRVRGKSHHGDGSRGIKPSG
jgi:hypothetical protein